MNGMICTPTHVHAKYMPVDTVVVVIGGDGVLGAVVRSVGCSVVVGTTIRSTHIEYPSNIF